MRFRLWSAGGVGLLIAALTLLAACDSAGKPTAKNAARGAVAVGGIAPDIEGTDLDGVAFRLSDYRGKVVVVDFWAGW